MSGADRGEPGADVWSRRPLAALYDLQLPLERRALQALARGLRVDRGDRVLDVGTGTGAMLRELAALPDPPRLATGVDRSAAMLARVPSLPRGWELVEADAAELPFDSASFDRVVLGYLLHLLDREERRAVLAEAQRVLRPGGLLGTITVAPPVGRTAQAVWAPLRAVARRGGGLLRGLLPLDPTDELIAAGLRPLRRQRTRGGYPSLGLIAAR